MAYSTDEFKGSSAFLPAGISVPGHGRPVVLGPRGDVFISTHTFSHLTDYDYRVELGDGENNWMPIPYAYVKGGTEANPGVVRLTGLPTGASIRAYVTRIAGTDGVLSVSVLTDR